MRFSTLFCVTLVGAGIAVAQDSEPNPTATLVDLLTDESTVAYRMDRDSKEYVLKLISPAEARASREHYSNRRAILAEYRKLFEEMLAITKRQSRQRALGEELDPADNRAIAELTARIGKVSRPTGTYRVGEITRPGDDFNGIRELNSNIERLVPIRRITHVEPLPKNDADKSRELAQSAPPSILSSLMLNAQSQDVPAGSSRRPRSLSFVAAGARWWSSIRDLRTLCLACRTTLAKWTFPGGDVLPKTRARNSQTCFRSRRTCLPGRPEAPTEIGKAYLSASYLKLTDSR